jgi:hypothetical protein
MFVLNCSHEQPALNSCWQGITGQVKLAGSTPQLDEFMITVADGEDLILSRSIIFC